MSAGGTVEDVKLGPGRLWVAAIGTTEPTSASAALPSADWSPIGYTEDGNAYATDLTQEPVEVAEEYDPIFYELVRRISRVNFSMAEATARNLVLALGGGAARANDAAPIDLGELSNTSVMLVWDSEEDAAGNDDNVRWIYRQASPSGTVEIGRRKAPAKTLIPVTFNLEKPTDLTPVRVFPNADGHIS
jgi:hypothetical protein